MLASLQLPSQSSIATYYKMVVIVYTLNHLFQVKINAILQLQHNRSKFR